MGTKNGNPAFQRMMEGLLQPVRDCADPFVDDIIIGSGTEDMTNDELIKAHEKDLRRVLGVFDEHSMVWKPTKTSLFVREVEFAGHVVGQGQRRPMPGKLAALRHLENPKSSIHASPSWDFATIIRICTNVCGSLGASPQDATDGHVRWSQGKLEKIGMDNQS